MAFSESNKRSISLDVRYNKNADYKIIIKIRISFRSSFVIYNKKIVNLKKDLIIESLIDSFDKYQRLKTDHSKETNWVISTQISKKKKFKIKYLNQLL